MLTILHKGLEDVAKQMIENQGLVISKNLRGR